jgi:hypothetical protein
LLLPLTVLGALAPGYAHAHPEPTPTLVNRYVTLAPAEAKLGVQLTFLYGDVPAGELRRQLDRDGDGTIAAAELSTERRAWLDRQASATPLLRLLVDGRPTPLEVTLKIDLGGKHGTGPQPLLVDLTASVPLDPGEHRLQVELGPDVPRMGETELMLDASNPWSLRATLDAQSQALAQPQPLIRFPGPRAHPDDKRAGGFVIRSDGPLKPPGEGPGLGAPIALVALAVVMGVVLTLLVRRMDRRAQAPGSPDRDPPR